MSDQSTEIIKIEQTPSEVISTATLAAKELTKIVASREKKLVLGGKQYLYFEDWQTLGKFYGLTAKVVSSNEIREDGKLIGFLAYAVVLANDIEVSAADAECTYDEPNWRAKPRFQLRSMAQTRACAKALRNCLGWVAVLAGYEPTPAEEMTHSEKTAPVKTPAKAKPKVESTPVNPDDVEFDGSKVQSFGDLWTRCKNYGIPKSEGLQLLELDNQEQIIDLDEAWKTIFDRKFGKEESESEPKDIPF